MADYQVAVIEKPAGWTPEGLDDVPPQPGEPIELQPAGVDPWEAVRQAAALNEVHRDAGDRWAVVVEPGTPGRTWPAARLCTPLRYQVAAIWWPEGWEPGGPLDVPRCPWQTQGYLGHSPMSYQRAEATAAALNRQCMDRPEATWHVVVAVENEPVSRTVSSDPSGTEVTVEVRRLHVIRPEGAGHGDCSHCPAHGFPCAETEWKSVAQTTRTVTP
ncbi:MAG: hypothetical protein ACOC46_01935 [Pirellulales bacterium]